MKKGGARRPVRETCDWPLLHRPKFKKSTYKQGADTSCELLLEGCQILSHEGKSTVLQWAAPPVESAVEWSFAVVFRK